VEVAVEATGAVATAVMAAAAVVTAVAAAVTVAAVVIVVDTLRDMEEVRTIYSNVKVKH
jgi:hypothetical protein